MQLNVKKLTRLINVFKDLAKSSDDFVLLGKLHAEKKAQKPLPSKS